MTAMATYQMFIDWDNDGGLFAGSFEGSLDGWGSAGTLPPALDLSSTAAHIGDQSMRITWTAYTPSGTGDTGVEVKFGVSGRGFDQGRFGGGAGSDTDPPYAFKVFPKLIPGRLYTMSAWVYVPSTGGQHVVIAVDGIAQSSASTLTDEFQKLTVDFIAASDTEDIRIAPSTNTSGGEVTYADEIMITGPGEDVTLRTLGVRTPLDINYGRDQVRSLSAVAPGSMDIELNNKSRDYSPNNPGSVIAGLLGSGKPIVVKSTYNGTSHVLFNGYLDDYVIVPDKSNRSVQLTCLDMLSKLNANVSTEVFESLRTGDGIHKILDSIGWPVDKRDIDPGATIMQFWYADSETGMDALNKILQSEGPPCIAYVSSSNNFVFRDRHHRLLQPNSTNVQATYVDSGPEPQFSQPMTYDIGWKDIVNTVDVNVDQRAVGDLGVVFTSTDVIVLNAGESRLLTIQADDPFIDAIIPIETTDYVLQYGSVNFALSRTSGASVDVTITAVTQSAVNGFTIRAKPITAARTYRVFVQDANSVADNNGPVPYDGDMPWANLNDAYAVAAILLGQRAQRLPVVTITINNGNSVRLNDMLVRDISDRVHLVEAETFTDHDFFVEKIEHSVVDVGVNHTTVLSCEQVRTQVSPVFTFDDSSAGFDTGLFGLDGLDDATSVFVLDVSNLDEGLLGT
jgi:hypothetical protein